MFKPTPSAPANPLQQTCRIIIDRASYITVNTVLQEAITSMFLYILFTFQSHYYKHCFKQRLRQYFYMLLLCCYIV